MLLHVLTLLFPFFQPGDMAHSFHRISFLASALSPVESIFVLVSDPLAAQLGMVQEPDAHAPGEDGETMNNLMGLLDD
jgi:hypothetical protein